LELLYESLEYTSDPFAIWPKFLKTKAVENAAHWFFPWNSKPVLIGMSKLFGSSTTENSCFGNGDKIKIVPMKRKEINIISSTNFIFTIPFFDPISSTEIVILHNVP
jgi:hypothetical protein